MSIVRFILLVLLLCGQPFLALAQDIHQNAFGIAEIRVSASNGSTVPHKQVCRFTAVDYRGEIVLVTAGHCFESPGRGSELEKTIVRFAWGNIRISPSQVVVFYDQGPDPEAKDAAIVYLDREGQDRLRPYALELADRLPREDENLFLVSSRKNPAKGLRSSECSVLLHQKRFRAGNEDGSDSITRSDFVADCDSRKQLKSGFSGSGIVSNQGVYYGTFFISVPGNDLGFNAAFSSIDGDMLVVPETIASLN